MPHHLSSVCAESSHQLLASTAFPPVLIRMGQQPGRCALQSLLYLSGDHCMKAEITKAVKA